MSTSDLYVLFGDRTKHLAAFRNGWGSAPVAWDHLAAKYIPERPTFSLSETHLRKVWDLFQDPRLQLHERIVLGMTFDRSFVAIGDLDVAAGACERLHGECGPGARANHWLAIGEAIRHARGEDLGPGARGLALSCTSVSDGWIDPSQEWLADAWSILAELN